MLPIQKYKERRDTRLVLPGLDERAASDLSAKLMQWQKYINEDLWRRRQEFTALMDVEPIQTVVDRNTEMQRKKFDELTNKWWPKYKQSKGRLSPKDIGELTREVRDIELWQKNIKGVEEEYLNAKNSLMSDDYKQYNLPESMERLKMYERKGERPEGGFLVKKTLDTQNFWNKKLIERAKQGKVLGYKPGQHGLTTVSQEIPSLDTEQERKNFFINNLDENLVQVYTNQYLDPDYMPETKVDSKGNSIPLLEWAFKKDEDALIYYNELTRSQAGATSKKDLPIFVEKNPVTDKYQFRGKEEIAEFKDVKIGEETYNDVTINEAYVSKLPKDVEVPAEIKAKFPNYEDEYHGVVSVNVPQWKDKNIEELQEAIESSFGSSAFNLFLLWNGLKATQSKDPIHKKTFTMPLSWFKPELERQGIFLVGLTVDENGNPITEKLAIEQQKEADKEFFEYYDPNIKKQDKNSILGVK